MEDTNIEDLKNVIIYQAIEIQAYRRELKMWIKSNKKITEELRTYRKPTKPCNANREDSN